MSDDPTLAILGGPLIAIVTVYGVWYVIDRINRRQ